jgi:predicted nucleic acid-binding protein
MEAFATLNTVKRRHDQFMRDFETQINDCGRAIVWLDREERCDYLEKAAIEVAETFNRLRNGLLLAVDALNAVAEKMEASTDAIRWALENSVLEDPTDNLILACILEHGKRSSIPHKAFVTEDKHFHRIVEARNAILGAGIKPFRDAQKCRDWLASLITGAGSS